MRNSEMERSKQTQQDNDDLIEPVPPTTSNDTITAQERQLPEGSASSSSPHGQENVIASKKSLRFYALVLSLYVCSFLLSPRPSESLPIY